MKAVKRFEKFRHKLSQKDTATVYVLKADIKHYFDEVDHGILMQIIRNRIADKRVLWLIKKILQNYSSKKGMPLGNLTSQFFANVYLNELDQFVKHELREKYYIRYVDDFVILHSCKRVLWESKTKINKYVNERLKLDLHPEKTKIYDTSRGIHFLGLKLFPYHRLIKKKNTRSFQRKLNEVCKQYDHNEITYDEVYDFLEGWIAYPKNADTYKFIKKMMKKVEVRFNGEISEKEINRIQK